MAEPRAASTSSTCIESGIVAAAPEAISATARRRTRLSSALAEASYLPMRTGIPNTSKNAIQSRRA